MALGTSFLYNCHVMGSLSIQFLKDSSLELLQRNLYLCVVFFGVNSSFCHVITNSYESWAFCCCSQEKLQWLHCFALLPRCMESYFCLCSRTCIDTLIWATLEGVWRGLHCSKWQWSAFFLVLIGHPLSPDLSLYVQCIFFF